MRRRGFILQASYRVRDRVPVVHLYGCTDDGETFLVRDRRQRPHFYVRAADAARAQPLVPALSTTTKHAIDGTPVLQVTAAVPADVPAIRDRLHAAGIDTFEADLRFAVRYLIERGIKGGCEIDGPAVAGAGIDWIFDDPQLAPADVEVTPRVLSFDIETDADATELLAIALHGCGADEVLVVDPDGRPAPARAQSFADERGALDAFCQRVAQLDPDVLTGWNIVDFDLTVLQRIAQRLGHPLQLGREAGALRIRPPQGYFGSGAASIPGRLVLDGIDLLRGAFVRMDDYSLDAVARTVLGEGKALHGAAADRLHELQHNYRHDLEAFAHYARTDARLAFDIVKHLELVRLAFARSRFTGMTPDRVAASIASFDFLYLTELERRGLVAPSVRTDAARVHVAQQGGQVLDPVPGVHANVCVFDFTSLYPSIIRTFNIDPLAHVTGAAADPATAVGAPADSAAVADLIVIPGAAAFRREPGILPGMLDELFPRREAARRAGDAVASQAIKILMNSFYGVLGTPACRFHSAALANAITAQGRHLLQWSKRWFEAEGYRVLYGDTDSLFVQLGDGDPDALDRAGPALAAKLTEALTEYVAQRWRVTSRLALNFEKRYVKLILPRVRHGSGGARKRYAGLVAGRSTEDVDFVGMEVVRRDWTALAKQVQRELYYRLFTDQRVDDYLAGIVRRLRDGGLDDALVYRKGLRKDMDAYTASTPPHVVAARKSASPPGRIVAYVMTTAGPEPVNELRHPPDREHYVDKQIRPVAEPVLSALGLDFARVIGDDRQLDLF